MYRRTALQTECSRLGRRGVDEGGVLGLAVVAGQLVFLVVGILLPQGLGVVGGPDPLGRGRYYNTCSSFYRLLDNS